MKKLFFVFFCVLFVLYACKKSVSTFYGTITATVNGTVDTFNANVIALKDSISGTYSLSVVGFQSAYGDSLAGGFESAEIGFQITDSSRVTTGTYITDSTTGRLVAMRYTPSNTYAYDSVTANAPSPPPSVVITKITAANVQGTFSGLTFYSDSSYATNNAMVTKAIITNGTFNVNIVQ